MAPTYLATKIQKSSFKTSNKLLLNKTNARVIAHKAIFSIVVNKKSLSDDIFPVDSDDLSYAKSLTFGSIRFYHHLNDVITPRLKRPLEKKNLDIHCLLILGVYQLIHSDTPAHAAINETVGVAEIIGKPWAKSFINAILRDIDRDREIIENTKHYSHPSWLIKKLKQDYPKNFQEILIANNKKAPMTIRVHPSIQRDDYQKQLQEINILSEPSTIAPQALILNDAVSVTKLPGFKNGSCYVQDTSAQLAAQLISPKKGELILDACSAPGGKATHLAELCSKATIIALDSDKQRLSKVQENLDRFKNHNISIQQGDARDQEWWDGKLFDKILLDAPCSSTGVIRRHPDIKLLKKPKDISQITKTQSLILGNLWGLLKPGGLLLYATCSVLKDENVHQISQFLDKFEDAKNEKITLPWGDGDIGKQQLPLKEYDGFYYAKLIKNH
jgi:16S rRNA (cytosine967-C5)-methyltransferase